MYRPTFVAVVRIVPGDGHLSPLCKGAAHYEPRLYVVILSFLYVICHLDGMRKTRLGTRTTSGCMSLRV